MAIKNDTSLSDFSQRLLALMQEQECDTPKALAKRLLDEKLVHVNTRGKDIYKNRDNAIGSIEKKIRNHLKSEDATCLQGEFVNAYCQFFGCSADYLFGYSSIRTPDVNVQQICLKTGLSEKVVQRLINSMGNEETKHYSQGWDQILESDLFFGIIDNWQNAGEQAMLAAQKSVEKKKILEKLKSASGPTIMDLKMDLEGVEQTLSSSNAAYAGLLFNISRNMAGFVEYALNPVVEQFRNLFEDKYL